MHLPDNAMTSIAATAKPADREAVESLLRSLILDVADFPKPGVGFKDITPLLEHAAGFRACIEALAADAAARRPDALIAIEARGFIFGAPLAMQMGLPLIVVRKPGKLPRRTESVAYQLEYGEDRLEVHADAIVAGRRHVLVDDVLATGGTAAAVASLVTRLGGVLAGCTFPIELAFLDGCSRLSGVPVDSLVSYR